MTAQKIETQKWQGELTSGSLGIVFYDKWQAFCYMCSFSILSYYFRLIASQHGSVKLFIWEDWVHFCTLRKTALMLLHDRSSYESEIPTSAVQNIKPVISLWKKRYQKTNAAKVASKFGCIKLNISSNT